MMRAAPALLAARMRALAAFAPGYFHDLKGPLNNIVLRLELLRAAATDERRRASAAAIEEQVRRLDQWLHAWLAQTAPVAGDEVCDLRALAQDVVALAAPAARKRQVALTATLPDAALPVRMAAEVLGVALLDLLRVALEGGGSGALCVALDARGAEAIVALRGVPIPAADAALAGEIVASAGGTCTLAGDGVCLTVPLA